jgi:glycosyltransferase involved in cell wall biosynthesis
MKKNIFLSVITPTYNEEDGIEACIAAVREILKSYSENLKYEHLIIDNDSSDGTAKLVEEASKLDKNIRLIVNSRNIGASRSIFRALGKTEGLWVIPMLPADLQDPVEVIPKFLDLIQDGETEVVYGVRKNRKESWSLRTLRAIYYRIVRKFSNVKMQANAGEFALVSRKVIDAIVLTNDQYPYVRGLISQTGARFRTVEYEWQTRKSGKSKASPLELIDVAVNGLISTSQIPARIALICGFLLSSIGITSAGFYLGATLIFGVSIGTGIPTLIISLLFISGIQLFFLGLIGEYVLSIHRQIKVEPPVYSRIETNS